MVNDYNKQDEKRITWVDMAKGMGIIFMFLGHVTGPKYGGISETVRIWIYSFHMPLFFFLSGYVFKIEKYKKYKKFLISKVKTIIFPIIFFSIVTVIFEIIYYRILLGHSEYNMTSQFNSLLSIVLQHKEGKYVSHFWFLPCLFVSENIFYLILRISNKYKKNDILVITTLLIYILGIIYINICGILLPWSIETSAIALVFVTTGYLYRAYEGVCSIINWKIRCFILFAINMGATYANHIMSGVYVDMYMDTIGNEIIFVVGAISAILAIVILLKNTKDILFINYIGKNSLLFYGFLKINCCIPNILLYNIMSTSFEELGNKGVVIAILYTCVQCVVTIPMVEIVNRKMKILVGRI